MATRKLQPPGKAQIIDLVHRLDEAKARHAEAVQAADAASAEVEKLEGQLDQFLAAGRCEENHLTPAPASKPGLPKPGDPAYPALEDKSVKKCWRIAFQLWRDPVLDYQYVAEKIWGPKVDKTTAKNRVNAHMTSLKNDGVVVAKGSNVFEVNPDKLAEKSHIPVPPKTTNGRSAVA